MRILLALGREVEEPVTTAAAIAALARDHEVIVTHAGGERISHILELDLRNRLPERDVVSVLTQVVLAGDDQRPSAIAEARSLRTLLDAGAVVICTESARLPVALDGDGNLQEVDAAVDGNQATALLARRLDADLLLRPPQLVTLAA